MYGFLQNDHSCYLFNCGNSDICVFAKHESYWAGRLTRDTVKSGTKSTHEDALQNLGTVNKGDAKSEETIQTSPPSTVTAVTTLSTSTMKPGLY